MATQAPIDAAAPLKIKSPIKLVHVVFRTSRMTEMLAWYKKVLNATEAFVGENISFLAYDDEYHSVAFIEIPALAKQPAGQVGVHHVAFTYNGPDTLLSNSERLKRRGSSRSGRSTMAPRSRSMTLTPTGTSWGFRSIPATRSRKGGDFFFSDQFAINPIGVDVNSAKLREHSGPRGVETIPIR